MNLWLQLGLGGAALLILYTKQKSDSKVMRDEMKANREQQQQMLDAVINKDDSKTQDLNRLIDKIDKLVESNHEISLSFIQSVTKDDAVFADFKTHFGEIKGYLLLISEKYEKGISKMHNRVDKIGEDVAVLLNNTNKCLKK